MPTKDPRPWKEVVLALPQALAEWDWGEGRGEEGGGRMG